MTEAKEPSLVSELIAVTEAFGTLLGSTKPASHHALE